MLFICLQLLAQKLYEKDPSKLGQWDPNEMMPHHMLSSGDTSSEGEEDPPPPDLRLLPPAPAPPSQEPLKCVINIRNSSVSLNHKGVKHKSEDRDASDRRTEPDSQ